jgi:glycine cleavage system H protein
MVQDDRKYAKSHEWAKVEGDVVVVGISDHAQDSLGDITFVELPEVDQEVKKGSDCCVIESVKAASDIYAPVTGIICEVNSELDSTPEDINSSPFDKGWIFKIKNFQKSDLKDLLDAAAYESFLEEVE